MSIAMMTPNNRTKINLKKLDEIEKLSQNWDKYGAEPLSQRLINETRELLKKIYIQPEIFPTATGNIQIEYEKENGDYLEIQLTPEQQCEIYIATKDNEHYEKINQNANEINKLVNNFYGLSI